MGLLSNPLRTRQSRPSRLPLYKKAHKERLSDDEDYYASSDDSDFNSNGSSPSNTSSRVTSSSRSSTAAMLPKKNNYPAPTNSRLLSARPYFYRLPNKIIRYLCLGLGLTIVIMILTLVRASQNENRRLAEGKVTKGSEPAPVWEQFDFLTRYYGGIRNLVPLDDNTPQYPRGRDELPLTELELDIDISVNVTTSEDGVDDAATKRNLPQSKPVADHPKSVFRTNAEGQEDMVECFIDRDGKHPVPSPRYYEGRPKGFADHVLGSYELLDLPEDICYERYGRYGPYGFGYSLRTGGLGVGEHGEMEGSQDVWETVGKVDYREVDWAEVQRRCYQTNAARFKAMPPRPPVSPGFYVNDGAVEEPALATRDEGTTNADADAAEANTSAKTTAEREGAEAAEQPAQKDTPDGDGESDSKDDSPHKLSRTAVIIRAWDEYFFRADDIMNIRSIISELSLASGGRYDVHLLVQVKNDAANPIWADHEAYERRIRESIPEEFRGLVTLWTETQMLSVYQGMHDLFTQGPDLPVHGVYRGLTMALQHFAYAHPEYDYFWSWEMDVRYTGHYYDLFSKLERFAREQPRKGLWERNARFYLPGVHGSWEDFRQMTRVQTEMGTTTADNMWDDVPGSTSSREGQRHHQQRPGGDKPIWGPERPADKDDWFDADNDPQPPTSYEKDKYEWGVGEEADLIALNPIFNPEGTTWSLADDVTGYNGNDRSRPLPPRRAHIVTASRLSRRLLTTMHRETAYKKHFAFPEMWPATVALQHGFKAVFAPHPQFVDRAWPVEYLGQVLNAGRNGASGGARSAVFGQREHNMRGLTWFYNSGFGPNLYRRWLGLKVNNDGGERFELEGDEDKNGTSVSEMRGGEGRMCLPPMLIHPVKEVELPVEGSPKETEKAQEIPESDPNA